MTRKILFISVLLLAGQYALAQHFYHRLDVGTGNIYSFVAGNLITAGLNAAADDMLFDNAYSYTHTKLSAVGQSVDTKGYNVMGLTARDLFNDVRLGAKLGYQSFSPGSFNWGIYGSAHYKVNRFKTALDGGADLSKHNVQRALLGGGVMFILGNIGSSTRVIIDAGLRLDMPISYKGACGNKAADVLNSGLSSHYSIRFGGTGRLQGVGVYADIPHYNMFKSGGPYFDNPKMKMYSLGIIYTISPWKTKNAYDR